MARSSKNPEKDRQSKRIFEGIHAYGSPKHGNWTPVFVHEDDQIPFFGRLHAIRTLILLPPIPPFSIILRFHLFSPNAPNPRSPKSKSTTESDRRDGDDLSG